MDNLPPELIQSPKPLVYVTGTVENEPDIHERLIKSVSLDDSKESPGIEFKSVPLTHKYIDKKPPKEQPSTEGILKSNWLKKHVELIPSVVVMVMNFCIDWPAGEWIRREAAALESLTKLRNALNTRDVKVILLAIKTGTGIIDKDVIEERTNSMKKHFQLDGRNFMVMTVSDFNPLSVMVRRLSKVIRDFSSSYYATQGRRLRNIERMVRPADVLLIARYNFKVAFFYEFQNQIPRALRHYRHSYVALVDMIDSYDDDMVDQVKAIAEMVNFKICSIMLLTGVAKESSAQFRSHTSNFSAAFSGKPWRHYAWVAQQYIIYADMLTKYNINSSFTDADKTYYYHNAALFSLKRQSSFNAHKRASRNDESFENLLEGFHGMTLTPPTYFGGQPQLLDPVLDQVQPKTDEVKKLVRQYLIDKEAATNHTEVILSLLRKALEHVNPLHKRRRSHLRVLIAKQLMNMGSYDLASANLNPAIEFLGKEKWAFCAIPVLRKKMACSVYLGRPREYIPAALMLYSIASSSYLGKHDKEELHRDVMSIITNTEKPTEEYVSNLRATGRGRGAVSGDYLGLPLRPEYGIAAVDGHPPEYFLPDGYVVDLSDTTAGLFDIKVKFDRSSVEVGQYVKTELTITSLLHGPLSFAEMSAHFTDDLIVQRFYDDDADEGAGGVRTRGRVDSTSSCIPDDHNISEASLKFESKKTVVYSFDLFIPESTLASTADAFVCLEKLIMTMRVALPLKTSGEEVALEDEVSFQPASTPTPPECLEEDLGVSAENDVVLSEAQEKLENNVCNENSIEANEGQQTSQPLDVSLDEVGDFEPSHSAVSVVEGEEREVEVEEAFGQLSADDHSDVESCTHSDTEDDVLGDTAFEQLIQEVHETDDAEFSDFQSPDLGDSAITDMLPATAPAPDAVEEVNVVSSDLPSPQDINSEMPPESPEPAVDVGDVEVVTDGVDDDARSEETDLDSDIRMTLVEPQLLGDFDGDAVMGKMTMTADFASPPDTHTPESTVHDSSRASQSLGDSDKGQASSVPTTRAVSSEIQVQSMKERGYREVVVEVSAISRAFKEARNSLNRTSGNLRELSMFLGADGPKTLHIARPKSRLALLHPAQDSITILQGTIQRVNFIFSCGADKIVNGRIYLSSDYTQHFPSGGGDFFWYPDIDPNADCSEPQKHLDSVQFHPFQLNESFQPAYPFVVPYQGINSVFCCPVFIKSDVQGDINLKLRVEYVPKGFLKTAVSNEFSLKVTCLKPFGMNFNISSINDPHCGVEKKHGASVVLRGDRINVSASLDCVNSLGDGLEISMMAISPKTHSKGGQVASNIFEIVDSPAGGDLLYTGAHNLPITSTGSSELQAYICESGEGRAVVLHKGEAYVGSVDMHCKDIPPEESAPSFPMHKDTRTGASYVVKPVRASMGNVMVNWRIQDSSLMSPVDLRPYRLAAALSRDTSQDKSGPVPVSSWLLPLENVTPAPIEGGAQETHQEGKSSAACVNRNVSRSRVCSMMFSIPEVQVIDAPFSVEIDSPTMGDLGQPLDVRITVHNKLWSLERMQLVVEMCDDFVITGGTSQILEIAPADRTEIGLSLVPLECGQIPLPHVVLTWERSKTTILEFGTYSIPRHVFVRPVGCGSN